MFNSRFYDIVRLDKIYYIEGIQNSFSDKRMRDKYRRVRISKTCQKQLKRLEKRSKLTIKYFNIPYRMECTMLYNAPIEFCFNIAEIN